MNRNELETIAMWCRSYLFNNEHVSRKEETERCIRELRKAVNISASVGHYSWEYEESVTQYYHVIPVTEEAEDMTGFPAFTLTIPRTPWNDVELMVILDALDRLVERNLVR